MTPLAEKFLREHVDESNAVKWPEDDAAKVDVAQTLLGMWFVGESDYWYKYAEDVVVNPQPPTPYAHPPLNDAEQKDRAYREAFATLDETQREAVLRLLQNVVEGTAFSCLVTLDQFAHAKVVVELRNREGEPPYRVQAVPGNDGVGIHERWHEWLIDFSEV
jgi:hypothetical protein